MDDRVGESLPESLFQRSRRRGALPRRVLGEGHEGSIAARVEDQDRSRLHCVPMDRVSDLPSIPEYPAGTCCKRVSKVWPRLPTHYPQP